MAVGLDEARRRPLLRAALLVPTVITLVFGFFTLTAAPDPARVAGSIRFGVINQDQGLRFPPINIGSRLIEGIGGRLPFQVLNPSDEATARSMLEAGALSAVLILPEPFSATVLSGEPVTYRLILAEHLPSAEAQIAGQLPAMLDAAMSAAVQSMRLALANGELPTIAMPVTGTVERLHPIERPAGRVAPFVAVFTTWLAAMVGALMLNLATRDLPARTAAALRSLVPVAATLLSAAMLVLILVPTAGSAAGSVPLALGAWALSLALALAMGGLLAWTGPAGLIFLLPVVFYQAAIGGAQMPTAGASPWLARIGAAVPFDQVGAVYRALILGGPVPQAGMLAASVAAAGLSLIWLRALAGPRAARFSGR